MTIRHFRRGAGPPLLLVHGLGSSHRAWRPVLAALEAVREVVAIDLPGHGASPAKADSGSFAGLAGSLEAWLAAEGLAGADMAGHSMGARLVLEMARRGRSGAAVALAPGGFWKGWERGFVRASLAGARGLLGALRPALPRLGRSPSARAVLLAQLSARPRALDGDLAAAELAGLARTATLPALARDLAWGPMQPGPAAAAAGPVTIGWGRRDRLCLPVQAERAMAAFPGARLVWFERSGHYPHWDEPVAAAALILAATAGG
jgi:pimeloyl-ACP methyl ester carboxylesterase